MCYLFCSMRFFFCLMIVHVSMVYAAAQPPQDISQSDGALQNKIQQLAMMAVAQNDAQRAKSTVQSKRKLTRAQRSPIASPLACPVGSPARPLMPKPAQ